VVAEPPQLRFPCSAHPLKHPISRSEPKDDGLNVAGNRSLKAHPFEARLVM